MRSRRIHRTDRLHSSSRLRYPSRVQRGIHLAHAVGFPCGSPSSFAWKEQLYGDRGRSRGNVDARSGTQLDEGWLLTRHWTALLQRRRVHTMSQIKEWLYHLHLPSSLFLFYLLLLSTCRICDAAPRTPQPFSPLPGPVLFLPSNISRGFCRGE